MVIYLGFYQDTEVWSFVKHDHSRITWAILGLFAIGVLASLALTLILTWESVHVDALEKIARKYGWNGVVNARKNLNVGRYFRSLGTIITNNGDLDIEALVDVEFAIYQRLAHALEIIGNMLITLGLIGTVVGLTLTLTGLTASMEALGEDQMRLLSGLRSAMGGMGTAFYTTLLGSLLGGILLRVFAHINQNGVESLEESLTRICLVHCSADFKPSVERDVRLLNAEVEHLARSITALQQVLHDSRQTIADFAGELQRLREIEADDRSVRKAIELRRQYHQVLHEEFQIRRLQKGRWWQALRNSLRPIK